VGVEGAGEKAADTFFEELGAERSAKVRAISLDMGPGYAKSARKHAPQARICIDSYHVVALATKALDEVRRDYWNELRALGDQRAARRFKDARWALLKNPENLTEARPPPTASSNAPARGLARLHAEGGTQSDLHPRP